MERVGTEPPSSSISLLGFSKISETISKKDLDRATTKKKLKIIKIKYLVKRESCIQEWASVPCCLINARRMVGRTFMNPTSKRVGR